MEKFAVLSVDSLGIAHSDRATGTNRDSPDMDSGLLAFWHLGPHHVAGLKAEPLWPVAKNRIAATAPKRPATRNRPAAREKQASPLLRARHQLFLAFV
jgi:hypothetical protein